MGKVTQSKIYLNKTPENPFLHYKKKTMLILYKKYASLFFISIVDKEDNELMSLKKGRRFLNRQKIYY